MSSQLLHTQAKKYEKKLPELVPGMTVRVFEKVKEGDKERTQIFEGLIISIHKGHNMMDRSFTVRRVVSGVGVEKVFPLYSPVIEKIVVSKVAKVRRAKLSFLRGRSGKAARMSERFIESEDFGAAVAAPVAATPIEAEGPAAEEAKVADAK